MHTSLPQNVYLSQVDYLPSSSLTADIQESPPPPSPNQRDRIIQKRARVDSKWPKENSSLRP
eukprot:1393406-Amorphochlora_amoeboformis.AAC.1